MGDAADGDAAVVRSAVLHTQSNLFPKQDAPVPMRSQLAAVLTSALARLWG